MVLVVSPGHPMAGAGQVELAALRQLHFVSLQKSSTVQGIRNILQSHGVGCGRPQGGIVGRQRACCWCRRQDYHGDPFVVK